MSASGSGGFAFYARCALWALVALAAAYSAIVIYAYPHDHQQHLSDAEVAKIEAQKLTVADVDGTNLPPPPDPNQVNATIAGIDANANSIRDDVELAIFAEYPTSSATSTAVRAAELQYAMAEQMYLTNVFDQATWKAAAEEEARGYACIGQMYSKDDIQSSLNAVQQHSAEVESLIFNTDARQRQKVGITRYEVSFGLPDGPACDVDPDSIPGQ